VLFGSAWEATLGEIEEFVNGTQVAVDHDRMLTTLLFSDVVSSTDRVAAIGDRAWHTVLDRHDDFVRRQLERFSGHEEKFTGDGIVATFDGPVCPPLRNRDPRRRPPDRPRGPGRHSHW
jgi:class 3 adenylate cyclase